MKLEIFREKNKKKNQIIIFVVGCIMLITGVFLYQSYALFEAKDNFNVVSGDIDNPGDLYFAYYIDNEISLEMPKQYSGYTLDNEKSNCNNGVTISWDYGSWTAKIDYNNYKIEGKSKTRCNFYFKRKEEYSEPLLNGMDPVLKDELIPVTIDTNGTVYKADIKTEWYKYEDKKWANAIIKRDSYTALEKAGNIYGTTKQENYVALDGIADYIDLGLANYDFGTNLTFSMYIKINEDDARHDLLSNHEVAGAGLIINKGNLNFTIYDEVTEQYYQAQCSISEYLNQLVNLTATYDGQSIKLYINGELKNELKQELKLKTSPAPIFLGANPLPSEGAEWYTKMDVYQVAIYNRALTENEINQGFTSRIKIINTEKLLKYVDFTNHDFAVNEIIPEDEIDSYFVWIPKYRYQLWDLGDYDGLTKVDNSKVHEIPVIFGDYNTRDEVNGECTTPMTSGNIGNCKEGDYMTHPAFISIPSNGFWVGKFETSKGNDNSDNSKNPEGIQIKPNVSSWRNINVSNAFYTTYEYKRNLDSHMMKSTEWGAVAYLQQSKYGSQKSVRINNNSDCITGYASVEEPTCGYTATNEDCNRYGTTLDIAKPYNTEIGVFASTTGNITGIYDMAGGAWEYVMGVMADQNGNPLSGSNDSNNSGFNGSFGGGGSLDSGYDWPEEKYYDKYQYGADFLDYTRRILGDATGEMGPFESVTYGNQIGRLISSWYADHAYFVYSISPWFGYGRSYYYGSEVGIFAFSHYAGSAGSAGSFRVVLTP